MTDTTKPLNILLITSDQQHYSTLGAVNPRIQTPALDRLCSEGTRFDRAYCPNPTCTPTRATLLTGLMPSQHGAWTLGTKLMETVPTIGQALSHAGYATSLIGKAHFQPLASTPEYPSIECQPTLRDLDFWRSFHGPWYGFDHVETARMHGDESHAGQHYAIWLEEHGLADWKEYFRPWPETPDPTNTYYERENRTWKLPEELHYSVWTAERTIAQIEQAAATDRPFFCWSSFHDPHPPYIVPEPWASMYDPAEMQPGSLLEGEHEKNPVHFGLTQQPDAEEKFEKIFAGDGAIHGRGCHLRDPEELKKDVACYYGMTSLMDREIGRVLTRLDELGLTENTLVVFTTDHGHFLGQHGLTAKAIHHYEDLLRIPFLVRWPGQVPAGAVNDSLQNLVDLPTTFLAAAGAAVPYHYVGLDQQSTWAGGDPVRTGSITENHHGTTICNIRTYVNQRYKITVYAQWDDGELFDLQEDPGEVNNLWHEPASAELKQQLLLEFMQETMKSDSLPMPRIANA